MCLISLLCIEFLHFFGLQILCCAFGYYIWRRPPSVFRLFQAWQNRQQRQERRQRQQHGQNGDVELGDVDDEEINAGANNEEEPMDVPLPDSSTYV